MNIQNSSTSVACTLHFRELSLGSLIGTDILLCRMQEGLAPYAVQLCATVQLCNPTRGFLLSATVQLTVQLEGASACSKVRGGQCNRRMGRVLTLRALASYWRNPAISLCQRCSKLLCARPVQREWHRQGGQVDGHLGGECRRGMGLGLTLESCFTTVSKASPCGAPRTAEGEVTVIV